MSEHTIPAGQRDLVPDDGTEERQAVRLVGVSKRYGQRHNQVLALNEITVGFTRDTFTAIMGPSGSGKSTLLQCAAGLDGIDAGEVFLGPRSLRGRSARRVSGKLTGCSLRSREWEARRALVLKMSSSLGSSS